MRAMPSHAYMRLLRGELSSERYVAILQRAVRMGMSKRRELRFARYVNERYEDPRASRPQAECANKPASRLRSGERA